MLLNILLLLLLLFFLHSHARHVPGEQRLNINIGSNTNGSEFDRVIARYDFDLKPYADEIPPGICYMPSIISNVFPVHNDSGYVYCTDRNKGLKQMCPPGSKMSYEIGGCVNTTTNTTVFPIGSRCASQPCQNGGVCYDFSSADGYLCACTSPYEGLHCQLLDKPCPQSGCGGRVGKITVACKTYTSDMALDYICYCYDVSRRPWGVSYAANNCHTDQLFAPKCEGKPSAGALPFTNKGFYICPTGVDLFIDSCALHHVYNDTQKECVLENN